MKAYIIARDDPYVAVTKPDGTFEIKNLPAGEDIEFQVWHEQAPGGLEAKGGWSKGRSRSKCQPTASWTWPPSKCPLPRFH